MPSLAEQFVEELASSEDLRWSSERVQGLSARGDTRLLMEIDRAVVAAYRRGALDRGVCVAVSRDIDVSLALIPGSDQAEAALWLASEEPQDLSSTICPEGSRARRIASLLAAGKDPGVLAPLVERYRASDPFTEVLACLVQEIVLRRGRADAPPFLKLWQRLADAGHPLSRLPLALLSLEAALPAFLPSYSVASTSCALPFGPKHGSKNPVHAEAQPIVGIKEVTTPDSASRMGRPTEGWVERSNGRFEAHAFEAPSGGLRCVKLAALLVSLGLECLRGADAVYVYGLTPEQTLGYLFAAASEGGAYPSGDYGAYGRLEAWTSLAALARVELVDLERVEAAARECEWWYFEAQSDWFCQVAWDFGILALDPVRGRAAVLAATDTD